MMKGFRLGKGLIIAAVCSLVLLAVAGCSSSSNSESGSSANYASSADMAMPSEAAAPMEPSAKEESLPGTETSSSGSGGSSVAPAEPVRTNRMLIYTANITMEVKSYGDTYTEIQNLIHLSGGYIVGFSEEASSFEKTGLFTIKVPAGGFNGFLTKLEAIKHEQLNRSMKAQDVSEEYVDLGARLQAKQVVEKRLLDFMGKATRTDDLVTFSNELAKVQEEIERMKGRMRYLEQNVAYSTVELRVYQKLENGAAKMNENERTPLGKRMEAALRASLDVLVTVFEGMMILIAGLIPIALFASIIGIPILIWYRKQRGKAKRNDQNPPAPPPPSNI